MVWGMAAIGSLFSLGLSFIPNIYNDIYFSCYDHHEIAANIYYSIVDLRYGKYWRKVIH
jgi:hypothetical protein